MFVTTFRWKHARNDSVWQAARIAYEDYRDMLRKIQEKSGRHPTRILLNRNEVTERNFHKILKHTAEYCDVIFDNPNDNGPRQPPLVARADTPIPPPESGTLIRFALQFHHDKPGNLEEVEFYILDNGFEKAFGVK